MNDNPVGNSAERSTEGRAAFSFKPPRKPGFYQIKEGPDSEIEVGRLNDLKDWYVLGAENHRTAKQMVAAGWMFGREVNVEFEPAQPGYRELMAFVKCSEADALQSKEASEKVLVAHGWDYQDMSRSEFLGMLRTRALIVAESRVAK